MEEILKLFNDYLKRHKIESIYWNIRIYDDGSGDLLDYYDNAIFYFDTIDELKQKLSE